MNINQTCNAFWNGGTVNFYRDRRGSCRNTGEIAAIFDHEWGHGMDNNGVNPNISGPGEAIADIHALLPPEHVLHRPRRSSRPGTCGGYGDAVPAPAPACATWTSRTTRSGLPHGINWIHGHTARRSRPPRALQRARRTARDRSRRRPAGTCTSATCGRRPSTSTPNTALELTTRLTYLGSQTLTDWYTCAAAARPAARGCGATGGYMLFLAADDDDGNLGNGTPHMTRHQRGLQPAPDRLRHAARGRNSGCAGGPTGAPVVTAAAQDQAISLSWTAVPGATRYAVYRTEGVARARSARSGWARPPAPRFLDVGLQNGRAYSYSVWPIGANSACFGRMSACTTATPSPGPNLGFQAAFAVVPEGGDGDPFLDNCETGRATFTVENTGTGTLTNVRVTGVTLSHAIPRRSSSTPLPAVIAPSLTDCASAVGSVQFTPQGMAFGDTLQLQVTVTSDQAGPRTLLLTLGRTESDFQAVASRTYTFDAGFQGWAVTSGIFTRVDTGGGNFHLSSSEFLNDQCDLVRSPLMRLKATSTLSLQERYATGPPHPLRSRERRRGGRRGGHPHDHRPRRRPAVRPASGHCRRGLRRLRTGRLGRHLPRLLQHQHLVPGRRQPGRRRSPPAWSSWRSPTARTA